MNNKITTQMVSNRQKKKRLIVRAFVMTLFMALFTQFAQAQDVYMHTGSRTVTSGEKVKFYDTGGASSGPDYYWERWFQRNEEFTFTFVPAESGKKIKATFNEFTAYLDNGGYNHAIGADWSLRLNTAVLKVYAGNDVNEGNLISSYTGNMTGVFSIVTDGPMTFYFHSYSYREEGWFAEVEMVDEYTIEKPTISFEACSDYVVLNANNPGVKIYYTTDGSDPSVPSKDMLSAGILYTEPFAVEVGKTIRAIAYDETLDETSAVASKTFTTATPTPGIPSISREGNTITMKPAAISEEINETYEVWYSTTSNVFSETDFTQYTRPFEWTQPHTTFYLVTRAKSCSDKMSEVISFPFDKVQVPDPTINFEVTNETTGVGTVTIKCAEGYVISYTLDGSEPAEANGSDSPVVLTDIAPGTTVKAIAFKANASNDYQKSNTITNLCLPGGEGSGGVYGDVVLLDDREDRTWSYYNDATQPIHRLKPADIKITYFGYGEKTMTSTNTDQRPANTAFTTDVDATQVAVNVDEGGNEFIYFKTLENDNTEGQDQGNTYSYTMIPNPFQVRPLYMADKGNNGTMEKSPRIGNIDLQSYAPTEALGVNRGTSDVTYEKVTSSQSDWSGTYLLVYDYSTTEGYALSGVNSSYHGTYTSVTKTNSGNTIASPGSAVLLTFAPYSEDNSYYTVQINNGDYLYSAYSGLMTGSTATNGTYTYDGSTVNYYCYYNVSYSNGTLYLNCPRWQSSGNYYYMQFNTSSNYFDEQLSGTSNYSFPSLYKQTTSGGGGEECAEVGTVNTNNYATTYGPVNDYYNYGYYQIIYPKANVPVGNITSIGFNYRYSTAMTAKNNVTIYMGTTSSNSLSSWVNLNTMTKVYTGNLNCTQGWNDFDLDTPYSYSGADNLIVVIMDQSGNYNGSSYTFYYAQSSYNVNHYAYADNQNYITFPTNDTGTPTVSNSATSSTTSYFPVTRFCTAGGYTVTYDANGGSGTMTDPNSPYEEGSTVTVLANSFTAPQYKVFNGWNTAANGSGTSYAAGATFTINANTTLYAQWVDDGVTRYNVNIASGITGGTVTSNTAIAAQGETVTLTIAAESGYSLKSITVTGNNSGTTMTLTGSGNTRYFTMPAENVTVTAVFYNPADAYRGFYAWRVKKMSSGLQIKVDNQTYTSSNIANGIILYADQDIKFITDNAEGNEVEFEALWAKAYVNSSTHYDNASTYGYNNAYERNFKVGTSITTYSYPVTFSTINPDGSGTVGTVSQTSGYTCQNDVKFENMTISGASSATFTSAGYNLVFGRGISKTGAINRICGYTTSNGSTTVSDAVAYTIRLESGLFNEFDLLNNTGGQFGSTVQLKAVFGSDYDRANDDNEKLDLAPSGAVYGKSNLSLTYGVSFTNSSNRNSITYDWYVKSGQIQRNLLGTAEGGDQSIYLGNTGSNNTGRYLGKRRMTIEGGEMASIAGGITNAASGYETYAVNDGDPTVMIRMKGGTVRGSIYGAGEYGGASGDRTFVITGGDVHGWIAGGCNGTHTDGGELYGITRIYVGGKAKVEPTEDDPYIGGNTYSDNTLQGKNGAYGGYIFGAGCGLSPNGFDETAASPNWSLLESNTVGKVFGSRIVVADECVVGRDVYGGGNFGFVAGSSGDLGLTGNTDMKSEIYILGGTIHGDVQGGSNNSIGQKVKIFIKGGELVGREKENDDFPNNDLEGSVYGGSDSWGAINDSAIIEMTGGHLHGSIFGGGYGPKTDMKAGTFINVKGGTIDQNVYGGGEMGTVSNGDTHVTVSGGTMKDVYGAGKGATSENAKVTGQTHVTVTGGTVTNVYGGGEAGDVENVASSGNYTGKVVFNLTDSYGDGWNGASLNVAYGGTTQSLTISSGSSSSSTLTIGQGVTVTLTWTSGNFDSECGFTVQYEDGTVICTKPSSITSSWSYSFTTPTNTSTINDASFVTIDGANISGDVFGGGKMGYTTGNTQVNVESGNIRGNVFGGAYGEANKIFVAGMHTVNIMGGRVFGNVYGGSRNANDALTLTNPSETETRTSSVVNISAGQIDQQVYTAGFYGHTYGSVYTFIGKEAILNAPHKAPSFGDENEQAYKVGNLRIGKNVWAGGDWGDFQGGVFGASTVKGYSDIYVNGEGYDTETTDESASTYMNIGGSILGCGTSCDAGAQGRAIYVSNYGAAIASGSKEDFNEPYTEATRTLYSIQRADTLILDNAHLNFTGLAKINSIEATEKYAIYSFDKTVRMTGGSSLFMNALASQIMDFWSASCSNVYAANAEYSPVAYNQVEQTPNKIRVNGGNYIEIYHDKQINGTTGGYGMLNGFAYMMVAENASQNTCAYARPKQCQDTPIDTQYDNQNDGGWVSYDASKNTFDINGNSHSEEGVTLGDLVQMPYENHINSTKNGEQYFRIWRAGGVYSEREAVINILADGTNTFDFVDVSVKLPAWTSRNSYYIFQTQGDCPNFNTTIDYGADVMMYNSALTAANTWVHFDEQGKTQVSGSDEDALDEIRNNPNVNFGLVTLPGTAMAGSPLLVCNESDAFLAKPDANCLAVNRFTMGDFEKNPEVTFRITYSNLISTNMTWDPMYVTLVQMDENGKETDIVKIALVINIATTIDREFTTQVYAIMNGMGTPHDEYTAKVVLPVFELADVTSEHASDFQLMSVEFTPANGANWIARGGTYVDSTYFAMEIAAANNEDNSDGWDGTSVGMKDSYTNQNANGLHMGYTGGRTPFAFDFRLTYNGSATYTGTNPELGVLKFTLQYDNVKEYDVDPETGETLETYHSTTKTLIVYVQVIRRGKGAAFYLDGQHGSNANDAKTPDKAALSLSTIFNRLGFLPGDVVYVVNTVDVNEELEWVGTRFDNVTLYRYPGGHPLSQTQKKDEQGHPLYWDAENEEETTESEGNEPIMLVGEIEDNPDNVAFTGVMVNVMSKGNMYIRDITLDGHNVSHPSPVATETGTDAAVVAEAPLIDIASGGTAVMTSGSTAQYNTNNAENAQGGAVNIQDGGKLMMNENAMIRHNQTSGEGGAVYMAGTLIVADSIHIDTNYVANTLENVFLAAADKVITIGTSSSDDDFDSLSYKARIGVTKQLTADIDGYTRVVNVDNNSVVEWLETPYGVTPNNIIYHDGHVYNLVKYSDPTYLYWIGTWLTVQPHQPTEEEGGWISAYDIRTDRQLAWLISLVNGENWQEGNDFEGETIQINADIDMDYSIWVPIGTATHPFKGTLEGNGHVITGIRTPLVNKNAGMMGYTEGATIQNMVVEVDITGNSENVGTLIGTMNGGSLNNVEAAGNIEGKGNTVNLGGLVGAVIGAADNQATIHSSFAVNTLTASVETTVVAGLVGTLPKYCSLYNSYANVSLGEGNASTHTGGLVGDNSGFVENCYVINPIGPAFAYTNNGNIKYCYVAKGNTNYVGSGDGTLTGHGSYDVVKDRKELGYMYGDNAVEIVAGENAYVNTDSIIYLENHIPVWDGLLSTLNQWVRDEEHEGYTLWNRPISGDINGDLPVLAFAKDSCLVTTDGKFLLYNAKLDSLLGVYKDTKADLFLYKSATGIKNVPGNNLHVFIHEDAALIQDNGAKGEFKATVGVTFDNSDHGKHSRDFWGNKLNYDWHLLSTPLSDAKLGITYGDNSTDYNYWDENDKGQAVTVANSYMPDMERANMTADWPEKWDFYTYFEPQYHWINFKRNVNSHHHYDEPHDQIDYEGFEQTEEDEQGNLIAGRGYMAAINQDSYLNSTGTLNNGVVPIALTAQAPEDDAPDGFFTYDKGSNLVGNPYQAYLDLEVVADKTGMETFYIYDAEQGVYVPYEIGQSKNTVTPSQYIHPHQGFFVVTDKDNKDFAFTYEMATATKDEGSYFRANHIDYPLVNLFAENEQGNRDLAIIEFNRPVIGGAEKVNNLHNANFKIAAHLDGKGYGLLFTPEGTEKVPVHFRTAEDGTFTLRWETLNGTFTSLMLVDNLTGVRTNMLQEDHYTFNGSVDDYASRFYITYNVTSVDEIHGIGEEFAWFDGNDWIVTGKGQLEVIDVTGRVMLSRHVNGEQTRVNLHDVAAGVYMLRLTDGNKGKTQKIVIR